MNKFTIEDFSQGNEEVDVAQGTFDYIMDQIAEFEREMKIARKTKDANIIKQTKNKLVRLIGSGSGMIFKGSGFYETDYKKKPIPAANKKDSPKPANTPAAPAPSCAGCPHHTH